MAPKSSSSQAQFNANLRNRFNNHSLSSGPSSFPRRAPLPAGAAAAAPAAAAAAGSTRSAWTQASTDPKGKGKGKIEEIQEEELLKADNMARRLTRFYTSNFERRPVITLCITNCILSTFGDACAQLIPILGAAAGAPVPAWDLDRTLRFAMFGFSLGPLIEKWNRFLEYRFPLRPTAAVFGQTPGFMEDPNSPAFVDGLKRAAEKEGFRVNIDRGDAMQGQQYQGLNEKTGVVDPQHVAMPNVGNPGQISVKALFKRVAADQLIMAPLGLIIFLSTMSVLEGLEWEEIKERYRRLYFPLLIVNWQIWPFVQFINFRYLPLRYRVPFSASLGVLWTIFLSFKNSSAKTPAAA